MNHMMIRQYKMVKMVPCMRLASLMLLTILAGGVWGQTEISDVNGLKGMAADGNYKIVEDIDASSFSSSINAFSGTLTAEAKDDGTFPIISNLSVPIFTTATGANISNIMLKSVSISQNGYVGAICGTANGATRIYNCGILPTTSDGIADPEDEATNPSTIASKNSYCGSIVGFLDGSARVINCFSFANIEDGTVKAGIVGYNNVASLYNNLQTMVMNCMFYGNIAHKTNATVYPIYGGKEISNDYNNNTTKRLNNYNYFLYEAPYSEERHISNYNCALAAERRFLVRFEFYRHLLNSTRELASWYVFGSVQDDAHSKIHKWVLDKTIAPYPILKVQKKYPSVVNYDPEKTYDADKKEMVVRSSIGADTPNKGRHLGTLSVSISESNTTTGGQTKPAGASVTETSLTLNRTDKDLDDYNFNYDKVQLPYYNDIGNGNYTGNRVVTGWKITGFTGGTQGERVAADFTTTINYDAPYYNFADRDTYAKDLYSISGRVFAQGAYFNVPTGVTGITIEPYWAVCTYLSDAYYDSYGYINGGNNDIFGTRYQNDKEGIINGSSQKVYTDINNAVTKLTGVSSPTVYDYAVVLVGNYHRCNGDELSSGTTPFTIMSIDNNQDNEPDYSLIFKSAKNKECSPIRYDFLNVPAASMAHKMASSTDLAIPGNCFPKGWYEVTTTALIRFGQLEYSAGVTALSPLILMGGVVEQVVSTNNGYTDKRKYLLFGDNVWFKMFNNGAHGDRPEGTPHRPISVTGGEYERFYLTGYFLYEKGTRAFITDNAECYIDGGKFGEVAGAGQEKVDGNVNWFVNNADIECFYGGGINEQLPITGNITSQLNNCRIDLFCGGPKFGNMNDNKQVITTATGCTFGTYFGAGYGGNAIYQDRPKNEYKELNYNWTNWINDSYDKSGGENYRGKFKKDQGIAIGYEYEFFAGSSGNVARLYIQKVSLSLATTHNVTSKLNNCRITEDFFGGGNLGKVAGNVTSTLNNCTVNGSVYGAGYSASVPEVEVFDLGGFDPTPNYNQSTGVYEQGHFPTKKTFIWQQVKSISNGAQCLDGNYIKTTQNLSDLGTVSGNVTLNIIGDKTNITGNVYGGGALASSNTNFYKENNPDTNTKTTINLLGGTITGDAYGGGLGRIGKKSASDPAKHEIEPVAAYVGNTKVNLNGMDADDYNADEYGDWGLIPNGGDTPTAYTVADAKKGCVLTGTANGRIFGCNNLLGSPKGIATVHIYATQNANATRITNPVKSSSDSGDGDDDEEEEPTEKVKGRYDVNAVYGGGNLAAYVPTDLENGTTRVIIDGCDRTSIKTVYGGGNAASTPATDVTVKGTFEIEELFGGGNGADRLPDGSENPGANVGFKDYSAVENTYNTKELRESDTDFIRNYVYGTGKASVTMYGGQVHRVFGGSNTKGNVRQTAVTMLDDANDCEFAVEEAYGGGKSAPMDAEAQLLMSCIPGLNVAYGGAEAADIQGNVTLNISNGTFNQVFGGNNISGTIRGAITVNIEETGCKPIVIGELYGGGNLAAYSVYGYREETKTVTDDEGNEEEVKTWVPVRPDDEDAPSIPLYSHPTINVKSFTRIGEVYGGGLGASAVMVGNPIVNIDQVPGKFAHLIDADDDGTADNNSEQLGTIGNVYGGGNEADVVGNTNVNIATHDTIDFLTKDEDADSTEAQPRTGVTVKGANITGNVFGGGNHAAVTGNSNVTIGKQATTE